MDSLIKIVSMTLEKIRGEPYFPDLVKELTKSSIANTKIPITMVDSEIQSAIVLLLRSQVGGWIFGSLSRMFDGRENPPSPPKGI